MRYKFSKPYSFEKREQRVEKRDGISNQNE